MRQLVLAEFPGRRHSQRDRRLSAIRRVAGILLRHHGRFEERLTNQSGELRKPRDVLLRRRFLSLPPPKFDFDVQQALEQHGAGLLFNAVHAAFDRSWLAAFELMTNFAAHRLNIVEDI